MSRKKEGEVSQEGEVKEGRRWSPIKRRRRRCMKEGEGKAQEGRVSWLGGKKEG